MTTKPATPGQVTRLQVLWQQYASRSIGGVGGTADRHARLLWASENCGRNITSFKDLTTMEASSLIEVLQLSMGIVNSRPSRRQANAMGNEGRRGRKADIATIVSADDLQRIQFQLARLGWDQSRLERFLCATSSPLRGRTQIRTRAEANKVTWALKRMADQQAKRNKVNG